MPRFFLHILGCQMNYADAARIEAVFSSLGWEKADQANAADCYIFVTCSVRKKAEDRVFGFLDRLEAWKKAKPGRQIALTGCMVRQTSRQDSRKKDHLLHQSPLLDFVFRIEYAGKLGELLGENPIANNSESTPAEKIAAFFKIKPRTQNLEPSTSNLAPSTSVLIPIMTGCDNYCSYCIVPYARGREISRPAADIIEECKNAIENGVCEITLLGQNVNSYQKARGAFAELLEQVAQIPNLQRLRFVSSHPKDFDNSVIQVMAQYPNIEHHLHLPAQHGDDEILRRMNRQYTNAEYLEKIRQLRVQLPEASITTDLIVGFPGESDQAFENLLNFYREAAFDFAYFSKYSPRPGTAAMQLGDPVTPSEKSRRWHTLNTLMIATTSAKYATLKNKTLEVLVERCEGDTCEGRSSEFYLTKFPGTPDLIGQIVPVKITQPREVELVGSRC